MYLSASDVARIFGWPLTRVYKLALRDEWGRYTLDGKVRYYLKDVQASYDKRVSAA